MMTRPLVLKPRSFAGALARRASRNARIARTLLAAQNVRAAMRGYRYGAGLVATDTVPSSRAAGALEAYFDAHVEGPGIFKWRHYFDVYERHLAKFVGDNVTVVEVGVFGGGSLAMWRSYFGERSQIYGVDLDPRCRMREDARIKVVIGDQASPFFWSEFCADVPRIDVVIDDGGHEPRQQIATLEALLPQIRPGGVYVCEDVLGAFAPFHSYIDGFARMLHEVWRPPHPMHHHVNSIHVYPGVIVIEKTDGPVPPFEAPTRGTDWRPFSRPDSPRATS